MYFGNKGKYPQLGFFSNTYNTIEMIFETHACSIQTVTLS